MRQGVNKRGITRVKCLDMWIRYFPKDKIVPDLNRQSWLKDMVKWTQND